MGLVHGVLAYGLWGVVAAYWKQLLHVDPVALVAHRAVWAAVSFAVLTVAFGQWSAFVAALRTPRTAGIMLVSGSLIGVNWTLFVWATNNGHLLDASLGYFVTPLLSVALGTLVLREHLSRLAWVAIALAAIGVTFLTVRLGRFPWVTLALAATFGLYGLVRKVARVDALVGSTIETVWIAPVAAVYLIVTGGDAAYTDTPTSLLLAGTGLVTAVPLVLFTSAARRLPLSTVGFLQYLAPTGQFILAFAVYGEALPSERLAAFCVIWAGLAVFSLNLWRQRQSPSRSR
ncbi:MAG: EamA family transporter RarD [Deltaproteobacteria bacterium]|nr:EamA family transporter RarD [Deltaproteobacteria bacterium]